MNLSRLRSLPSSARLFNGSSQYLSLTAAPVGNNEPFTLFCWGKSTAITTAGTAFGLTTTANAYGGYELRLHTTSVLRGLKTTDAGGVGTPPVAGTFVSGQWHALGATYTSNTARAAWFDGATGTSTSNLADPTIDTISVGAKVDDSPGHFWTGAVAHAAIWNVVLTAEEMTALQVYRWCPLLIRPASLVAYWPLCFGFDGDLAGRGYHLTPTDSPTWTAGPRGIVYPRPTWRPAKAAEAAAVTSRGVIIGGGMAL